MQGEGCVGGGGEGMTPRVYGGSGLTTQLTHTTLYYSPAGKECPHKPAYSHHPFYWALEMRRRRKKCQILPWNKSGKRGKFYYSIHHFNSILTYCAVFRINTVGALKKRLPSNIDFMRPIWGLSEKKLILLVNVHYPSPTHTHTPTRTHQWTETIIICAPVMSALFRSSLFQFFWISLRLRELPTYFMHC